MKHKLISELKLSFPQEMREGYVWSAIAGICRTRGQLMSNTELSTPASVLIMHYVTVTANRFLPECKLSALARLVFQLHKWIIMVLSVSS